MIHFPQLKEEEKETSQILTRDKVMETFDISISTLRRWTKEYGLPYHKVNRRVFFKTDEFYNWFNTYKIQEN